ncbi:MAG: NOG1 family protein [Candidatus Hodarchaeota archaeon]
MLKFSNSENPFRNIKTVLSPQELLAAAFKRAMKVSVKGSGDSLTRTKRLETRRITVAKEFLEERLTQISQEFPDLDIIHPFYQEIIEISIGQDKLKKMLGSIQNSTKGLQKILRDQIRGINTAQRPQQAKFARQIAFTRFSSFINELGEDGRFERLISLRHLLRKLPAIANTLTVVIAGFPNAGKSTLLANLTCAKAEIGSYPFTTKNVQIGHYQLKHHLIQLVDTPGILDRPLSERKDMELKAIAAIKSLAQVVLFLFDASSSAYPENEQLNLYSEIKSMLPTVPHMFVINKIDLISKTDLNDLKKSLKRKYNIEAYSFSAKTLESVEELFEQIKQLTGSITKS